MKAKRFPLLLAFFLALTTAVADPALPSSDEAVITAKNHEDIPAEKLTLWYEAPGTDWMDEALPIGNGQFGCTFFGGVAEEQIQFNDKTLWTGTTGNPVASGTYGSYRNFGNLFVRQTGVENGTVVTNYRRELDIHNALGRVGYTIDGVDYQREYLVSHPAEAAALSFKASGKGNINLVLTLVDGNEQDYSQNASGVNYTQEGITFSGKLDLLSYYFRLALKPYGEDAVVTATADGICVEHADSLLIVMRGTTNYSCTTPDYIFDAAKLPALVDDIVAQAVARDFSSLEAEHTADYRSLFDRCELVLTEADVNRVPTNELIRNYNRSSESYLDNRFLEELYFNYGRYLMISCARGIDLPSNLQGIWNHSNHPAWNADIHSNINVQMNYWPAEVTNLSELHMNFINYVYNEAVGRAPVTQWQKNVFEYLTIDDKTLQEPGGWFLTTENNIFGRCSTWTGQYYAVANAWYCMHLWQHYEYTLDKEYLAKTAMPVMLSAVAFWKNRLVKDEKDGMWICPREFSPEQGPRGATTAHAQQLVYTLFENTLKGCDVLGRKSGVSRTEIKEMKSIFDHLDNGLHTEVVDRANGERLLCEWKDYSQQDTGEWPHHRHLSHLIGLYPGTMISETANDSIYQAALRSLTWRGLAATGWAMGWKTNLWARAHHSKNARTLLHNALNVARTDGNTSYNGDGAGVYNNLFDAHPPYQIDGNFGVCAGIAEMLMQSHAGYIELLPACPEDWAAGHIHGLKAQGNVTVDIDWNEGKPSSVALTSAKKQPCRVLSRTVSHWKVTDDKGRKVKAKVAADGVVTFKAKAGVVYTLQPKQ